jgi:hypothetical protein
VKESAAISDARYPAPVDDNDGDDALLAVRQLKVQVSHLHLKVDELLEDSRRARPLLDSYLLRAGGWVGIGKGKRSRAK